MMADYGLFLLVHRLLIQFASEEKQILLLVSQWTLVQ